MKGVQTVVFRSLSFLLVGLLMVAFPDKVTEWLVVIIGLLFLVPGLVSVVSYFRSWSQKDATRMLLPVIGIGSTIMGTMLIVSPAAFIRWLMYALGILLLLAGISGCSDVLRMRRMAQVGWFFYVVPVLLCATGVYIVSRPMEAASLPFIIFGIASILYGIAGLVWSVRFRKYYHVSRQDTSTIPSDNQDTMSES